MEEGREGRKIWMGGGVKEEQDESKKKKSEAPGPHVLQGN